jgi:thiopurine S-methyltransferase
MDEVPERAGMKKEFWLERWERQEIGFHQDEVNAHLISYREALDPAPGSTVFVPLCGKSRDMLWLREQGHPVIGVELSPIAVEAFFVENGYTPNTSMLRNFRQCEADGIRILCGDFFDLTADDLEGVATVYDRASLVALPPEMRQKYANHLLDILRPEAKILLITFEYDQAAMSGPPFAVTPEEVYALYGKRAKVEKLETFDILEDTPRFKARGLSRLHENIFIVTKSPLAK